MYYTIQAANNKGADQTARMLDILLFAYGKNRFSHDVARMSVGFLTKAIYLIVSIKRIWIDILLGSGSASTAKVKPRGGSRMGEEKIKVCVRKRPLSRREIKSGEEDMARAISTTTITISEPKQAVDLTAYTLQVCILIP